MILVGIVMAVLSGLALPGHIILFGRVINQFIFHSIALSGDNSLTLIANNYTSNEGITCNVSVLRDFFADMMSQPADLLCEPEDGGIFSDVIEYACDPNSQLESEIHMFSLYYVGLGVAVLVSTFLANIFFNISAYRQTRQIRLAYYHSVLHQEIGWFDVNGVNKLSSRLTK